MEGATGGAGDAGHGGDGGVSGNGASGANGVSGASGVGGAGGGSGAGGAGGAAHEGLGRCAVLLFNLGLTMLGGNHDAAHLAWLPGLVRVRVWVRLGFGLGPR